MSPVQHAVSYYLRYLNKNGIFLFSSSVPSCFLLAERAGAGRYFPFNLTSPAAFPVKSTVHYWAPFRPGRVAQFNESPAQSFLSVAGKNGALFRLGRAVCQSRPIMPVRRGQKFPLVQECHQIKAPLGSDTIDLERWHSLSRRNFPREMSWWLKKKT